MELRLGLAGLGVHGLRYARHLLRGDVPGARLTAVCRRDAEAGRRFAGEHGLLFCDEPRELPAHRAVDAVVLALPPDLHPPAATACLERGRPVLVEKPLAANAASAAAVAREVERRGGWLMVAQTLRFDPLIEALRREAPRIGTLRAMAVNQRFEPSDRVWIDAPGRGGLILNTGVHEFDLLRHLSGREVRTVWARSRRVVTEHTEDLFTAMLELGSDRLLAVVDASRSTRARTGRIELVGDEGIVWGDHIHRTLVRVREREAIDLGPIEARPTVPAVLRAFVRSVREQSPPPVTAEDGLAALRIVDAAVRSARCGEAVAVDSRGGSGAP